MSDNSTPSTRFDGFTHAWEQRKLGELFEKAGSGGTPKSSVAEYYNGDIPFLSISDVSDSNGYIKQTTKMITEAGLQNSAAWIVPRGAISLAMYASVGKVAVLEIDAATSQAFYNMVFTDSSVRDFVYQCLVKANVEDSWRPFISTGTQANLNAEKVRNAVIYKPSDKQEIELINHYCSTVDSLIDLCRRKLDLLRQAKKALMQQIFSQQLRFKADDGSDFPEWEEKKLGDVGTFYGGLSGKSRSDFENGNARYLTYMNVYKNTFAHQDQTGLVKISDKETPHQVEYGDILFTQSSETVEEVGLSSVYLFNDRPYLNSFCMGFHPRALSELDPGYIGYCMRSIPVRRQIMLEGQGISRINISSARLSTITFKIPSLPEQQKIASCLSSADALIAQARVELEQWQEVKKSLLQQLFV